MFDGEEMRGRVFDVRCKLRGERSGIRKKKRRTTMREHGDMNKKGRRGVAGIDVGGLWRVEKRKLRLNGC